MYTPILLVLGELGIFAITLLIFFQKKIETSTRFLFILIGTSFLFLAYINLLTLLNIPITFLIEFKVFQTVLWSSALILIISKLTNIKRLKYLLLVIINSIIFILFTQNWFVLITNIAYYMAALSFFLLFILGEDKLKNAGFIGLLSALSSSILLYIEGVLPTSLFWLIPDILLIIAFAHFIRIERSIMNSENKIDVINNGQDFWKPFGYLIAYTFLLNISILITTSVLHEIGHSFVGGIIGCSGGDIILNLISSPELYTKLTCNILSSKILLGLSGFLFIIPFGIVFFLLRKFPEKNFGFIILGLAAVLSGTDFMFLFKDQYIHYIPIISGIILIIIGEVSFINDNLKSPS